MRCLNQKRGHERRGVARGGKIRVPTAAKPNGSSGFKKNVGEKIKGLNGVGKVRIEKTKNGGGKRCSLTTRQTGTGRKRGGSKKGGNNEPGLVGGTQRRTIRPKKAGLGIIKKENMLEGIPICNRREATEKIKRKGTKKLKRGAILTSKETHL